MRRAVQTVSFLVRDYDEAIAFFTGSLGFSLLEDTPLGGGKRWVRVAPPDAAGCVLLLARAVGPDQLAAVGRQAGGRVFLFLETTDFDGEHAALRSRGVRFLEEPRVESFGKVAVFADLYGNKWDLLEPARADSIRPRS